MPHLHNHVVPIPPGTHVLLIIMVAKILLTVEISICTVTDTEVDMVMETSMATGIGMDILTDTVTLINTGKPTSMIIGTRRGIGMVMAGTITKADMVTTMVMGDPLRASEVGASESSMRKESHLCSGDSFTTVSRILHVFAFVVP